MTKQVLVVRKDLNMRKGKIAAQCCHASMAFITKSIVKLGMDGIPLFNDSNEHLYIYRPTIQRWLDDSFRKICVYVNSEEELMEIYNKAKSKDLMVHLVEDNGATEFNGVKTKTCLAIGPHLDEDFIGLTNDLPLL